jgi:hypothetical protein
MNQLTRFDKGLSTGLAVFSVGLGLAELLAPRLVSRAAGLNASPGTVRALGLREIAGGVGMMARPASAAGPTARVAGDVMDLAVLGASRRRPFGARRLLAAIIVVAAVAAVDLLAAQRFARRT